MINNKTNAELLKEFDKHVIGHTKAKKALISLVNRSKTAHYYKHVSDNKKQIDTMNCMLVGGSGSGKTHLVNTLQRLVSFPLVRLDATTLEPSSGSRSLGSTKIKEIILDNARRLIALKQPDTYNSEQGTVDQTILFIDEVDKLAKSFESSGNWNTQVQAGLLSLIEGDSRFKNVSVIFAGAFADMDLGIDSRNNNIGFFKGGTPNVQKKRTITDKDIINYGLMPELIGRISTINVLDTLDYATMSTILNSILLPEKNELLRTYFNTNIPLISIKRKKEIIETAINSGQGVRSLKRELDSVFSELEFNFEADTYNSAL